MVLAMRTGTDPNQVRYRMAFSSVWNGTSAELEAMLRSLEILRARRLAQPILGDVPRFVVVDDGLPLCEDVVTGGGLAVIRQCRPQHLKGCADIMVDVPSDQILRAMGMPAFPGWEAY
jgi:hypothetical protein